MWNREDRYQPMLQIDQTTSAQPIDGATARRGQVISLPQDALIIVQRFGRYCSVCDESFNHKPKCTNQIYELATEQELTSKK